MAYHATLAPSNVISHYYTPVASDVQNFTSNLPIVIIETHNNGIGDEFGNAMSTIFIDVNQDTGLASMTDIPDFAGRSGLHIRGESSAGWPKKQYALELWDDNNEDRKASLLGMPAESDWVLNAPYSDKTLMRNVLAFKWANDIGKGFAAPGTRLVEVFLNDDGGSCSYSDYNGIYVLMEKIKVSENRLDIGNLQVTDNTEPEITGGYILRVDKNYQGEFGQFYTSANILNNPIQYFDPGDNLITPNPNDITNAQKTWIGNWLDGFESNLNSSSFDDPINGYAQYIDVESFIEYDIIAEIFKNADGLKLSTYFHKKKNGKLAFGPHWDYNLSTGNASEGCWEEYGAGYPAYMEKASTSEGWFNQTMPVYGWHEKLLLDSDYELRTADKWFEHREDKLSDAQIAADIDLFYGMVTENHTFSGGANNAADRNFTQWPNLDTWIHCNSFLGSTYISHIDRLRTWLHGNGTPKGDYSDRMQHVDDLWLSDRNIAAPPTLWINGSPMNTGGTITAGSTLTMT
ncbi:MAG: CotH kinase family protein, partial [Planctomycetota bacterium]